MRHTNPSDLRHSTALILKDDGETPDDIVTKALADLTASVDARLTEIEEKADTTKLAERLDKIEAKTNRAGGGGDDDQAETKEAERKAFAAYLRQGSSISEDDKKALTVSNDEQGGYFAPAEMSTEFIRNLVETSPVRSVASVRSITAPSVKYPKRTGITNAQWESEAEDSEESTVPFGQLEVPSRKLMTYVDLSNELMADGGTAETEVRTALAEDFGQKEGQAFVNGSGVKPPLDP